MKKNFRQYVKRLKELQGDPHYIAMGMAIGVFVSMTPTIPFHMIIAVSLACLLRGSIPAAALGSWVVAAGTPFFYIGGYKVGMFLFGNSPSGLNVILDLLKTLKDTIPFVEKCDIISDFLFHNLRIACATLIGGIIIGIIPGILSYFITYKMFINIRSRKTENPLKKQRTPHVSA